MSASVYTTRRSPVNCRVPQMLRSLRSLLWRFLLLAACIDVVIFTLLSSGLSQRTLTAQALFRSRQLTVRFLRGIDPYLEGRREDIDPAPRCCSGEDCLTAKPGRYAVVTALRSDSYLPLLKVLVCTLEKSNPGIPLIVLTSPGDLQQSSRDYIQSVAILHLAESIEVSRRHYKEDGRYALNWVKLAAWNLTEWQALLWIDSDATVDGDVASVFSLPTDFAATLDQGRTTMRYSALGKAQAGVFMLRPCKAVAQHMETLALSDTRLQFRYGHAEQDFLDWYFKYTRIALPLEWNAMAHRLTDDGRTIGGPRPRIIHFAEHKPVLSPGHAEYSLIPPACRDAVS